MTITLKETNSHQDHLEQHQWRLDHRWWNERLLSIFQLDRQRFQAQQYQILRLQTYYLKLLFMSHQWCIQCFWNETYLHRMMLISHCIYRQDFQQDHDSKYNFRSKMVDKNLNWEIIFQRYRGQFWYPVRSYHGWDSQLENIPNRNTPDRVNA